MTTPDSDLMASEDEWDNIEEIEVDLDKLESLVNNYKEPNYEKLNQHTGVRKPLVSVPGSRSRLRTTARLDLVIRYIHLAGFKSISEFLCALFTDQKKSYINICRRFFFQGGFSKVITLWFQDRRSLKLSKDHRKDVVRMVHRWCDDEIRQLERTHCLYQSGANFSSQTWKQCSLQDLGGIYMENCPILVYLMTKLTASSGKNDKKPKSGGPVEYDAATELESEGSENESSAEHNTRGGGVHGPRRPPAKRAKVQQEPQTRKNRQNICTTVLSILLFGRSWRLNYFQSMLGYYLNVEGTHKNCNETLHALGISASYSYIRESQKSNAKALIEELQERVKKECFMISWDNINRLVKVSHETLNNKSHMINWTSGSIIFLKSPGQQNEGFAVEQPMRVIPRNWVNEKPRSHLYGSALMLDQEAVNYYIPMCKGSISSVILKYFRQEAMLERKLPERYKWKPTTLPEVYVIPPRKCDAYILKTMELNEGTIDGTIQVMDEIVRKQLKLDDDALAGRRILCSGDQLSTKLLRVSRFLRNEEREGNNLNWAVAIIGLFHWRMSVLHMILR